MPWLLKPPISYIMEAQRLTSELQAQGVELDQAQAQELARASLGPERYWVEDATPSPALLLALEELATDREQRHVHTQDQVQCRGCQIGTHRHSPCTRASAEGLETPSPEASSLGDSTAMDVGTPAQRRTPSTQTTVRNVLNEQNDDEEMWS